jgi:ADP-ribose pyrophosphatase YjhB (NUDIX family)
MDRHKAIAIPVSGSEFLIVKDRRYNEWTFVTGGCRKREVLNPLRCAVRELEEETRGTLNLKTGTYSYFNFKTDQGYMYHVYIIDLPLSGTEKEQIVKKFDEERHKMDTNQMEFKKQYDENTHLDFDTLDGIKQRTLWPLIKRHVLDNPEFYSALRANRQTFSLGRY